MFVTSEFLIYVSNQRDPCFAGRRPIGFFLEPPVLHVTDHGKREHASSLKSQGMLRHDRSVAAIFHLHPDK